MEFFLPVGKVWKVFLLVSNTENTREGKRKRISRLTQYTTVKGISHLRE